MKLIELLLNAIQNFFDSFTARVEKLLGDMMGVDVTGNSPWLNEPASFSSEAMADLHGHVMMTLIGVIGLCISLTICAIFPSLLFDEKDGFPKNTPNWVLVSVNQFIDSRKELFSRLPHSSIEGLIIGFPILVTLLIAIPALHLLYITEESESPALTVKVVAHQWYWTYEFENSEIEAYLVPDSDIDSTSQLRLLSTYNFPILPANVPIRFVVTSTDVLHSWSVPGLGIKVDAVPGRLNQVVVTANRPGTYFGQCSELCGAAHGFMPIELRFE